MANVVPAPPSSPVSLDVGRLRLLREVGLRGSIAGAARALGLTASAVSQQVSVLEREAGAALIDRSSRGVSLTAAGSALAVRATQVLDVLGAARADLDRLYGAVAGPVSIASVASAAATFVSAAVAQLRTTHPDLAISLVSTEPDRGLGMLLAGDVDLAVVDEYDYVPLALPESAGVRELGSEPLVLVRAAGARPRRVPALRELADVTWVMPPEDAACGRAVRAACRAAGFEPRVAWHSDDMRLLVTAVADGHGIAVLPRRSVLESVGRIDIATLRDPVVHRHLRVVGRTPTMSRPAVAKVVSALVATARLPI